MNESATVRWKRTNLWDYRNLRWMISLFAVLLIVAIWAVAVYELGRDRQAEIAYTMRSNEVLVKSISENMRLGLLHIDDELTFMKSEFENWGGVTPEMSRRMAGLQNIPANHISIMDERGVYIASTAPLLIGETYAERNYFQFHVAHNEDRLYLDAPIDGRISEKTVAHASRRINHADGTLAGVAVISVDLERWARLIQSLHLEEGYEILVVGYDGFVRTHQRGNEMMLGENIGSYSFFSRITADDEGAFIGTSPFSGKRSIINYAKVREYPLIVSSISSEAAALGGYYQRRELAYAALIGSSLFLILFFGFLRNMVVTLQQVKNSLEIRVEQRTQELKQANEELSAMNDELQSLSQIDGLTGLVNRRYFNEMVEREWAGAKRQQRSLAVIMIDVDHFKEYNDGYGHQRGDECLREVARILKNSAQRVTDIVARYGGEEFVVVLPDADGAAAMAVAEKARQAVEELAMEHERSEIGVVTISQGVASAIPGKDDTIEQLIQVADIALYQAKKKGRNAVCGNGRCD